jgi:hypothetical protein
VSSETEEACASFAGAAEVRDGVVPPRGQMLFFVNVLVRILADLVGSVHFLGRELCSRWEK